MKKSLETRLRQWNSAPAACLGLILVTCFMVVGFTVKSYGASYDETSDYGYAKANLQVYLNQLPANPTRNSSILMTSATRVPLIFSWGKFLGTA